MTHAMQRHTSGQARVIPILLRHTEWKSAPCSNLQGLPRNGKPVVAWSDRDQAWSMIASEIRQLCKELRGV